MTEPVVRLHITPLTPETAPAVLGAKFSSVASNISYHSLQTFPESSYGFVDLPKMDAEKVMKKVNGAIVKGKKVKVEEARPAKRSHTEVEDNGDSVDEEHPISHKSKRTKKSANLIEGHELSPDRKVKRGWTETKSEQKLKKKDKKEKKLVSEKQQTPSKYTDKQEMLFKTKLPANKKDAEGSKSKTKQKDKSGVDVVHEFKHTTIAPSFLRDTKTTDTQTASAYQDGQGWVDEDGKVVEEESSRTSRRRKAAKLGLEIDVTKAQVLTKRIPTRHPPSPPSSKPTSGITSTITTSSKAEEDAEATSDNLSSDADETSSSGTSASSSDPVSDNELTPQPTKTTTPEVHPLEALFKKPHLPISQPTTTTTPATQATTTTTTPPPPPPSSTNKTPAKPTLEVNTTFSFFDPDTEEPDNDINPTNQIPTMPMTPFSSQDFRHRIMRSAAPTPDTADPRLSSQYGSIILGEDDSDDEELSDLENPTTTPNNQDREQITPSSSQQIGSNRDNNNKSEFEKKFWEQRGENNRAWKARRRAVLKENRQRENRSRRPKAW